MTWTDLDTRIALIAGFLAMACAGPGTFLALRRASMLTHAIAHAVLPGLVIAFLLAGSMNLGVLMLGALGIGVLTSLLIDGLANRARMDQGAATGVVFTAMFALGLLLLRVAADGVHLHADCVIEGRITLAATDVTTWLGMRMPRVAWLLLAMTALNTVVLAALWHPMLASVFDKDHARQQGLRPHLMHRVLLVLTTMTTVAAFEAVGSILVVAMMVIPAATAMLFANRVLSTLLWATAIGVACSIAGHVLAVIAPGPLTRALLGDEIGSRVTDTSTAGTIAATLGLVFAATAVATRWFTRQRGRGKPPVSRPDGDHLRTAETQATGRAHQQPLGAE